MVRRRPDAYRETLSNIKWGYVGGHGLKCPYLGEILDTPAAMLVMIPAS